MNMDGDFPMKYLYASLETIPVEYNRGVMKLKRKKGVGTLFVLMLVGVIFLPKALLEIIPLSPSRALGAAVSWQPLIRLPKLRG
jgi:hypothetical protein